MDGSADRPLIIARGESVALGPLRRELLPLYHRWFSDLSVQRTTRHPRHTPLAALEADFDAYVRAPGNEPFIVYALLADSPEELRPVGVAGLKDIDFRNRTAEYEIVLGEPDARGRGLGTEVTRLVLDYAFSVLSLRNVMLTVYANNPAGVRAYAKAGFREFGRRTAAVELAGELFDVIYMEALASDFESPSLRALLLPE